MSSAEFQKRRQTEKYVRQLYASGVYVRPLNDNKSNIEAFKQLTKMCPKARCGRFEPAFLTAAFDGKLRELAPQGLKIRYENFEQPLRLMIDIEELWAHVDMRKYDGPHDRIRAIKHPTEPNMSVFQCVRTELVSGQLSILPGDCIVLSNERQEAMMFNIDNIEGDLITFTKVRGERRPMIQSHRLAFVSSCIDTNRYSAAIKTVNCNTVYKNMLFPNGRQPVRSREPKIDFGRTYTAELEARLDRFNERQRQAIVNVVEARCRPNLYVIFGPPGTGKTATLVEMVVQIYKRAIGAEILVCSSANTCVDFIADLIADTNEIDSMVRLISEHRYKDVENRPGYYTNQKGDTDGRRLVLTTSSSAARLRNRQFDYVIIDEAGHSHIPESLIPLTKLKRDGYFVLAGDPKQLGPTIKCEMIKNFNMSQSLLFHMCLFDRYKSDERFITKLVDSYRCDPRILGLCSRLFYNNELKCHGETPQKLLDALKLAKPLVFAPVSGREMRPPHTSSRCNLPEAKRIIDFLIKLYRIGLHPDQIGVMTPYKFQKELLNDMLQNRIETEKVTLNKLLKSDKKFRFKDGGSVNGQQEDNVNSRLIDEARSDRKDDWKQNVRKAKTKKWIRKFNWICKIDTVDAFQGSEREIILISTVRTPIFNEKIDQPGFLMDFRRFNVAISRAKWLCVVFGHTAVLRHCGKAWRAYDEWSTRTVVD